MAANFSISFSQCLFLAAVVLTELYVVAVLITLKPAQIVRYSVDYYMLWLRKNV